MIEIEHLAAAAIGFATGGTIAAVTARFMLLRALNAGLRTERGKRLVAALSDGTIDEAEFMSVIRG